jgi:predicted GNAT family acetyltransferase
MLADEDEAEVLEFLSEHPARTFGMIGFIRSNGLVSEHNRGIFYACRDERGRLQGVSLIGHATLFEARSEEVIREFARVAQNHQGLNMLLGEQEEVQSFWGYYCVDGQKMRRYCRELLFEQSWPIEACEPVTGLRLATIDDLDQIVPVHALAVTEESGQDPLQSDPEGFRNRCRRRIEKGKTWVLIEDGKLVFKAEIFTDSPEVIYLEGIWVSPDRRGKGIGRCCLLQLAKGFLQRTHVISILVNEKNTAAQGFYEKAGYRLVGCYDSIFLKSQLK